MPAPAAPSLTCAARCLAGAILATDSAAGPQGLTLPPDLSMAASPHHVGLAQMPPPQKGSQGSGLETPLPHPILQFCSLNNIELYLDLP